MGAVLCGVALVASASATLPVQGPQSLPYVPVFTPGEAGYPCIRIPSMVLAPDDSTLIAYAECRNWTGDGCEPHHLRACASRARWPARGE